jgi:AraC-like DNA-binding protein
MRGLVIKGRGKSVSSHLEKIEDWEKLATLADFSLRQMADACGVSSRQLERYFQRRFGKTPRLWLCEFRYRMAWFLIDHGYSTKATALELGFSNPSHFCHEFKRIHGIRPQDIKRLRSSVKSFDDPTSTLPICANLS